MLDFLIQVAKQAVNAVFWYCVDFMVNLAQLTHSSYVEANTRILLLLIPALFVFLIIMRMVQYRQLRSLTLIQRTPVK